MCTYVSRSFAVWFALRLRWSAPRVRRACVVVFEVCPLFLPGISHLLRKEERKTEEMSEVGLEAERKPSIS